MSLSAIYCALAQAQPSPERVKVVVRPAVDGDTRQRPSAVIVHGAGYGVGYGQADIDLVAGLRDDDNRALRRNTAAWSTREQHIVTGRNVEPRDAIGCNRFRQRTAGRPVGEERAPRKSSGPELPRSRRFRFRRETAARNVDGHCSDVQAVRRSRPGHGARKRCEGERRHHRTGALRHRSLDSKLRQRPLRRPPSAARHRWREGRRNPPRSGARTTERPHSRFRPLRQVAGSWSASVPFADWIALTTGSASLMPPIADVTLAAGEKRNVNLRTKE